MPSIMYYQSTAQLAHVWSVSSSLIAYAGLGGYERLAAAEGQSRPSEHVFTFKAAMPSSDHYQSTAQLTNEAESWGSLMALDAKQLWDWMPVEVFLQTVGTTKDITNRLELSAIGKRLSECYIAVQLGHMQTWHQSEMDGPFALVLCKKSQSTLCTCCVQS